ncbi:sigma-70 family RNA polymerase sigma factor [Polymorphobacter sp.]|uniref:sigma-70 family RNA polymerase sigma factor n=1 Tax=Polymorphobacter sp. TaxID=1909290 RepID=UPI003F6F08D8
MNALMPMIATRMAPAARPALTAAEEADFRAQLLAIIPSLRAYARSLCHNRELADDLSQETLVKAWAARRSFQPGSNFRGWAFRILRNHFYSVVKVSNRFVELDPEITDRLMITPASQDAGLNLEDLQRGLRTLPVEQREALLLMESGLRCEDIATIMETPVGTVKSRISRGRAALRLYLDGRHAPSDARHGVASPARIAARP